MINVGNKPVTHRTAHAAGRLKARTETIHRIQQGTLEKGDAIATARIAGIMAAKQTSTIVPLCHPLPLDSVTVEIECTTQEILIDVIVEATARTGVEMEAMLAVTATALALYDMSKSIDPDMSIEAVYLKKKTGGIRGDYCRT